MKVENSNFPYNLSDDVRRLNADKLGELATEKTQPASKYHNIRAEMTGLRFSSGKEASEMGKLMLLDEKHLIFGLRLQVKFPLPNGESYTADATYMDIDGETNQLQIHIVDAKPDDFQTKEFKRKAKLFLAMYGQPIELI